MDKKLLLGVKMCGNCNPEIESVKVVKKIAGVLGAEIIPYDAEGADIKLSVSGCASACVAENYPAEIRITGLALNGGSCSDETELAAKASELIREKMNATAR